MIKKTVITRRREIFSREIQNYSTGPMHGKYLFSRSVQFIGIQLSYEKNLDNVVILKYVTLDKKIF